MAPDSLTYDFAQRSLEQLPVTLLKKILIKGNISEDVYSQNLAEERNETW